MFHRDFPTDAREMWDVIAKALLLRFHNGCGVELTADQLRGAAETQGEIEFTESGSINFRIEQH
jgi:hypothetical protein